MSNRLKEKISALVLSQVPEFIGNDFPLFVSFVEEYYKFLEQDQGAQEVIQNALDYSDIDATIEPFLKFFISSYAKQIPETLISDKRFLVKKINDLYESKGSELSYQVLFRSLFNDDVTVKYPFENVLRASGGRFEIRRSIRVLTVQGNRDQIPERNLTYFKNNVRFDVGIFNIKKLTSDLTEVFLDPNIVVPFEVGDTVTVTGQNNVLVFEGIIAPTTVNFQIQVKGKNFKVGQVFTVNFLDGIDTLVKVIKIDSEGGIEQLKFVNYGYNYASDFFSDFVSTQNASSPSLDVLIDPFTGVISSFRASRTEGFASHGIVEHYDSKTNFEIEFSSNNTQINRVNRTLGSRSSGQVYLFDESFSNANVTSAYFAEEYISLSNLAYSANIIDLRVFDVGNFSGEVEILGPSLKEFSRNVFVGSLDTDKDPEIATIRFILGAVGSYPGAYVVNDSFVSEEEVRLQDGQLYQPFAYQTNTVVDIRDFYDIVIKLLHPAGQVLYNNRIIKFDADLSSNITVLARANVFFIATDQVTTEDLHSFELLKDLEDSVDSPDNNDYVLTKPLVDDVEATEIYTSEFTKSEEDSANTSDELQPFDITKAISDQQIIAQQLELEFDKGDITDAFRMIELVLIQKDSYFAENYVEQFDDVSLSYVEIISTTVKTPIEIVINNSVFVEEQLSSELSREFEDSLNLNDSAEVQDFRFADELTLDDNGILFYYDSNNPDRYFDTAYQEGGYVQTSSDTF